MRLPRYRTRARSRKVHIVTDARPSLSQDIGYREKRYLIQMGIRTICLVLAVVVPAPWPIRALFIVGAIALPYFAVVFANGGREPANGPGPAPQKSPEDGQKGIPMHRREIRS